MVDTWLIFRGLGGEKGCCRCVALIPAVGTLTTDRKGGSWIVDPMVG